MAKSQKQRDRESILRLRRCVSHLDALDRVLRDHADTLPLDVEIQLTAAMAEVGLARAALEGDRA